MIQNLAASVHQRLLNLAQAEGRPFNEILQYFVLERFLHRLGQSTHCSHFVLKGALMFSIWKSPFSRPTRDIDLLGRLESSIDHLTAVIQEVCQTPVVQDGLEFNPATVTGERIIGEAAYEGVRVRLEASLGPARIPLQLDVGFGDPIVPGPAQIQLPAILDFPPPRLQGYSRESTIAEKLRAMVYLGEINSRMKDFYDVWLLAGQFSFEGAVLAQAIREAFLWRQTDLPEEPIAFSARFASNEEKQAQWQATVRRHRLGDAPATLTEAVQRISAFLQPVIQALLEKVPFERHWPPAGPWEACRERPEDGPRPRGEIV